MIKRSKKKTKEVEIIFWNAVYFSSMKVEIYERQWTLFLLEHEHELKQSFYDLFLQSKWNDKLI